MSILQVARPSFLEEEELRLYRDSVARFFDEHAGPEQLERWRDAGVVDRDLWRKAGAAGLLAPSIPEAYGGPGGDFRHDLVVLEEAGRRNLEGFGLAVHNSIAAPYILHLGTEAQKQRWLPGVVDGSVVLAIAMTEPGAGSDLQGVRTSAVRDGDAYILNGQKTFISNGQTADLIAVICRTGPGSGGISILLVEAAKASGFRRGRNLDKVGREAQDTSELFFDDVRVPAENLLGGEEGKGFAQLMQMLPQERIVIAAMGQAMVERALEVTVDHVKQRIAFGKPLLALQNTQFKLADAKTEATIARVFLDHCVERLLAGTLDTATASMAKLWITETECRIIDDCLQLFGGYGYMNEYPIARLFKDSRIDRIHGGASEIMKLVIARTL